VTDQELGIASLATPEGQAAIAPHLEGAALVVLDNLATLCRGGEENSSESWSIVQEWLLSLRRRNTSVLTVHHSGKSGAQRGTSAREDVLDVVLGLSHPSGYSAVEGLKAELRYEKSRGLYGVSVDPLEIELRSDINGVTTWAYRPLTDSQRREVVELRALGLSIRDIAEETSIPKSTVSRWLKEC
jgi:putative DNA primase/helicase